MISPVTRVPVGVAIGSAKTMINVPTLEESETSKVDEVTIRDVSGVLFTVNVPPVISPCAVLPPLFAMFG